MSQEPTFAQLALSFFLSTNSSTIDQVYLNPSLSMTQEQIKIHCDECDQIESKMVGHFDSCFVRSLRSLTVRQKTQKKKLAGPFEITNLDSSMGQ